MARCENCIHDKVCDMWAVVAGIPFVNADTCEYFSPTADVAPKSESLPLDVHEVLKQRAVEKAKAEVAREIFEEIERICVGMQDYTDYAELKKKYTEETQ